MHENLTFGVMKQLRTFQITIVIFNQSQSDVIFALKIFLISAAIVLNFFGIEYLHSNWLVGLFALLVAVYAEVSFLALYDHAFAIPVRAEYLRKVALQEVMSNRRRHQSIGVLKRQLKSVPTLGLKVGDFYSLGRDSTPKFLDFVANMTFTMLVTS